MRKLTKQLGSSAVMILLISSIAHAEVHEFQTCKLNPGKTPDDAYSAMERFSEWLKMTDRPAPKIAEIMWEFYSDNEPNTFVMHMVQPDFSKYGEVLHKRWDLGGFQNEPRRTDEDPAFSCSDGRLFWTSNRRSG